MNYYRNSKNKLKWILFSFVKWNNFFLKNNFTIMQNLTFNMKNPVILDKIRNKSKNFKRK